ncbi:MAG: photosynthetic reaction center cytochrome c subunit, partial [Acidobacteria bacterium]|nr:photosynthetic reaction center cytochrome c subunit [Acidobacteriota bacterium]
SSLGVECTFCHVHDAFEKDDKQTKRTARSMIKMVLGINGQNFQGERAVTCYSCHRGAARPIAIPMLESTAPYVSEAQSGAQTTVPSGQNLPAADQIIAQYTAAMGGEAAIARVSSRLEKGTISFGGGSTMRVEVLTKAPYKQTMIVHLPGGGDAVTTFDGERGWFSSPGSPVRDMNAADLGAARLDADLQLPAHLKDLFHELQVKDKVRVGDRELILVFAFNPQQPPLELYFDQQSGLLTREIRFAKSPLGLNPTQIDYGDYKSFDAVGIPLHVTITRPGRRIDLQLAEVAQNVPIDDSRFARPNSPSGR